MRPFKHVMILCGNAVGGGSITYANTMLVPPDVVWSEGSWKGARRWQREMPAHFATARRMLGVTENQILGDADRVLQADGRGPGRRRHVLQDRRRGVLRRQAPGEPHPDPYFGGEGPAARELHRLRRLHGRLPVQREEHARQELPVLRREARREDPRRDARRSTSSRSTAADGRDRLRVTIERSTAWFVRSSAARSPRATSCSSASALGTMDLLLRLKQRGSLPALSDRARRRRAHELASRSIGVRFPGQAVRHVEGHRDRLRHPHRSVHAHRGDALLARLRRARPARDDARRRQRLAADREVDRRRVSPSDQVRARRLAVRVRAPDADLARDADDRRDAAHAAAPPLVLAVPRAAVQRRRADPDEHSGRRTRSRSAPRPSSAESRSRRRPRSCSTCR